eukprot:m51a1_g14545 hypothetical protein (804) ;mRNA; f:978908-982071
MAQWDSDDAGPPAWSTTPSAAAAPASPADSRRELFRRVHRSKSVGANAAPDRHGGKHATMGTVAARPHSPPGGKGSGAGAFLKSLVHAGHRRRPTELSSSSGSALSPPPSPQCRGADPPAASRAPPHPSSPPCERGVQTSLPDRSEVATRLSRNLDRRPSQEFLTDHGILRTAKVSPLLAAKKVLLEAAKAKDQMKLNMMTFRKTRETPLPADGCVDDAGVQAAKRNAAVTDTLRRRARPLFGLSVRELRALYPDMRGGVPDALWACRERVLCELEAEGIFRVPGCFSRVQALRDDVEEARVIDWPEQDVHVVCSLIGYFFRSLPDPLVPEPVYDELVGLGRRFDETPGCPQARAAVSGACAKIPAHSLAVLRWFLLLLRDVVSQAELNRMHLDNVGVVFGPSLLRTASEVDALRNIRAQNAAVKMLVLHADAIPEPALADVDAAPRPDPEKVSLQSFLPRARVALPPPPPPADPAPAAPPVPACPAPPRPPAGAAGYEGDADEVAPAPPARKSPPTKPLPKRPVAELGHSRSASGADGVAVPRQPCALPASTSPSVLLDNLQRLRRASEGRRNRRNHSLGESDGCVAPAEPAEPAAPAATRAPAGPMHPVAVVTPQRPQRAARPLPSAPLAPKELGSPPPTRPPPARPAAARPVPASWQKPAAVRTLASGVSAQSSISHQRAGSSSAAVVTIGACKSFGGATAHPSSLRDEAPLRRSHPGEELCVALYDSDACYETELQLRQGEIVVLLAREGEWSKGSNESGCVGYFPTNYVEMLDPSSLFLSMTRRERARVIRDKLLVED